jgi:hypothetical protein
MDANPHHYKEDPDPSFYCNAVPDLTFHFNPRPLVYRTSMARYFEPLNFDSNADPDQAFLCTAISDPYSAFQNNAEPDPF